MRTSLSPVNLALAEITPFQQLDDNSLQKTGFKDANYRARQLLIKLGMEKVTIPDSLIIDPSKVTRDREAFDSRGYADVFSGRYRGEHVALRRIRSTSIDKVRALTRDNISF
jgi:hypothetical protein